MIGTEQHLNVAIVEPHEGDGKRALPAAAASGRRVLSAKDCLFGLILNILGVLLPGLISWTGGSISFPQNDGWAYSRVAAHFVATGAFSFTGWSSPTLVGQVLWSWPFLKILGDHGWVYGISTVFLAVVGISCAYYMARKVLAPSRAFLAVLLLLVFPGFAFNTSTFMTDVPALSAGFACISLGMAASTRRGSTRWALLICSLVVGIFAFSIRQLAIAAPVAVLLWLAFGDSASRRRRYLLIGAVEFVVCGLVYLWATWIPGGLASTITGPTISGALRLLEAFFTLAIVLSPAIAISAWRRIRDFSWAAIPGIVVSLAGLALLWRDHTVFVGNYLVQQGFQGTELLYGGRPLLLPTYLWDLLCLLACISAGLLTWVTADFIRRVHVRKLHRVDWNSPAVQLASFAAVMGAGLAVYCLVSSAFFDRYLWPLALPVAVLLLKTPRRQPVPRHIWAIGTVLSALLMITATAFTLNATAYSAARWHAANEAVAHGIRPAQVDAGFEWNGDHSTAILQPGLHRSSWRYFEPIYAQLEPGLRECALVSPTPVGDYLPQLRLAGVTDYRLLGFAGSYTFLFTYLVPGSSCP